MDTLYSFVSRLTGTKIVLTPTQLSYETGIAYMKKRIVIPVKEIASVMPSTLIPRITIETTGRAAHDLNVLSAKERERLFEALQAALAAQ